MIATLRRPSSSSDLDAQQNALRRVSLSKRSNRKRTLDESFTEPTIGDSSDEEDEDESVCIWNSSHRHNSTTREYESLLKEARDNKPYENKPYFVYLMASTTPPTKVRRMFTHIGKSREPVRKVLRHNEGRVNSGKRSTRPVAPNWRLEELIGPFNTRHEARQFQKNWFRNTKGVKQRIERGVKLANEHNRVCYTPRAVLNGNGSVIVNGKERFSHLKMRQESEKENDLQP